MVCRCTIQGHAGFHIWTGYSPHSNASRPNLVAEWLRVKDDPLMRQTFINTTLGEPYEDAGEFAMSEQRLIARVEVWGRRCRMACSCSPPGWIHRMTALKSPFSAGA